MEQWAKSRFYFQLRKTTTERLQMLETVCVCVKLFLIFVSSYGLKDSERDVRTLNFLLQGWNMCGFFRHSINYSCLYQISVYLPSFEGWGSVVSVVNCHRLDRDRIPVGGEIFRACPDWPTGLTSLLCDGYQVFFPGVKWPGRGNDTHLHTALRLKKK